MSGATAGLHEHVRPANDLVERSRTERCQCPLNFLGVDGDEIDDLFGCPGELAPEIIALGTHSNRTGVGVAMTEGTVVV